MIPPLGQEPVPEGPSETRTQQQKECVLVSFLNVHVRTRKPEVTRGVPLCLSHLSLQREEPCNRMAGPVITTEFLTPHHLHI